MNKIPKNIFHYTSLPVLLSIVEKKQIWATHSMLLNDLDEVDFYKNQFINRIEKINVNSKLKLFLRKSFLKQFESYSKNAFIVSCSTSKDSTGLWSNFSSTNGCCLKLNTDTLLENFRVNFPIHNFDYDSHVINTFTPKHKILEPSTILDINNQLYNTNIAEIFYGKVIYSRNILEKNIDSVIQQWIEADKFEEDSFDIREFILELGINRIFFAKKNGFKDENEFRFVIRFLDETNCGNFIHFRSSNGLIIPYIKININNLSIINEIILDPKLDLKLFSNSFELLLKYKNIENIKYSKSEINLRY